MAPTHPAHDPPVTSSPAGAIKSLGVIPNLRKPELADSIRVLYQWADGDSVALLVTEPIAALLPTTGSRARVRIVKEEQMPDQVDALLAMGGDGTILAALRMALSRGLPVLGVNLGSLGFLADVGPEHLAEALGKWQAGRCTIEERMTLEARIDGGDDAVLTAHNDVVVDKGEYSRVIDIDAFVNEHYVQRYTGDGLIVSTPAGSTAYALAAGGPILNPGMDALLSVPICPHTLAARPLVLPPSVELRLHVLSKHGTAQVTVDGQQRMVVPSGTTLRVRQGSHRARIVHTGLGYPFYEVLRQKLKLGFRLPAERS